MSHGSYPRVFFFPAGFFWPPSDSSSCVNCRSTLSLVLRLILRSCNRLWYNVLLLSLVLGLNCQNEPNGFSSCCVLRGGGEIASNSKCPGKDGIANFWIKNLPSLHKDLTNAYNDCICNPKTCPHWLTIGITYLLAKAKDTKNPKNYRPITCLPTTYKILTFIITERVYKHRDENDLLPKEQKSCRRGSYGCKD